MWRGTEGGPERLEHEVDYLLCHPVGGAEVDAGDDHEAKHNRGRLRHLAAIGPLYALQLCPAGAQESQRPVARRAPSGRGGAGL